MNIWVFIGAVWLFSAIAMAGVWAFSMKVKNVGYVDVAWAGLMAAAALFAGIVGGGADVIRVLVALLGGFWGARLCLHLLSRILHEDEDGRYQALRKEWNGSPGRFFMFFQLQAIIVMLFSVPFYIAASNPTISLSWIIVALLVWGGSIAGEAIADHQLNDFRKNPANRGKTCRIGLWGWSRHPNYFFEWLHWFSYVLLAVGSPIFIWSFIGPVVMFAFLYRVSGIPWTEAQALRSRGENYRTYQREVSEFFLWPPRRPSQQKRGIDVTH